MAAAHGRRAAAQEVPTLEQAWQELMHQPWIRPRANGRYVTLHDAMAEELAHRIIPLHDQDRQWQRHLWRRAMESTGMIADLAPRLDASRRYSTGVSTPCAAGRRGPGAHCPETTLIQEVAQFDAQKRELDQLRRHTSSISSCTISSSDAGCS